jgi:hypothetical protein
MYRDFAVSGQFGQLDINSQRSVLTAMYGYAEALNYGSMFAGDLDARTADVAVRYAEDAARASGALPEGFPQLGSDRRANATIFTALGMSGGGRLRAGVSRLSGAWYERSAIEVAPGSLWNSADTISPGNPWEQYVNRTQGLTAPEANNFKTFDGFDFGQELGVSSKAMNLGMPGYTNNPKSVYNTIKGYVDDAVNFPGDTKLGFRVRPEDVPNRTIELAVPPNPTPAQMQQLQNAIEYATQQGIKLNITKVK